jgi:RND family efflux transporter MFP subunit
VLLTSGGTPEVLVAVPEALIKDAREGGPAVVRIDALGGAPFAATLSEVGVAPTRGATTFPVTVRLLDPKGTDKTLDEIRSGMTAEVDLTFGDPEAEGVEMVPSVAVGEDRIGRFVFVGEGEAMVARRRAVELGELTPDGLEVREGVKAGERVVTAGLSQMTDGRPIRLLPGVGTEEELGG